MKKYDVLIVGGSHAGLSAAMAIGRLQRSALIVDGGQARNSVAEQAHNIAGLDGQGPNDLRENARRDLLEYKTIKFQKGFVESIRKVDGNFEAKLISGELILSRKVILAFGVKDELPAIDEIWDLWGKSVFHCPFCHGHEFKNKKIGLIGNGHYLEHMIPMMLNLSPDLIVFPQEALNVDNVVLKNIENRNIKVYSSKIKRLVRDNGRLKGVFLEDGVEIELNALLVAPVGKVRLSSDIGEQLSCDKDEDGFIKVDAIGKTSVDGIFAAGDITSRFQSVVQALASGQKAGAATIMELSHEDFWKDIER